jgi:hypothetical protein
VKSGVDNFAASVASCAVTVAGGVHAARTSQIPQSAPHGTIVPRLGAGDPALVASRATWTQPGRGFHPATITVRVPTGQRRGRPAGEGRCRDGAAPRPAQCNRRTETLRATARPTIAGQRSDGEHLARGAVDGDTATAKRAVEGCRKTLLPLRQGRPFGSPALLAGFRGGQGVKRT